MRLLVWARRVLRAPVRSLSSACLIAFDIVSERLLVISTSPSGQTGSRASRRRLLADRRLSSLLHLHFNVDHLDFGALPRVSEQAVRVALSRRTAYAEMRRRCLVPSRGRSSAIRHISFSRLLPDLIDATKTLALESARREQPDAQRTMQLRCTARPSCGPFLLAEYAQKAAPSRATPEA